MRLIYLETRWIRIITFGSEIRRAAVALWLHHQDEPLRRIQVVSSVPTHVHTAHKEVYEPELLVLRAVFDAAAKDSRVAPAARPQRQKLEKRHVQKSLRAHRRRLLDVIALLKVATVGDENDKGNRLNCWSARDSARTCRAVCAQLPFQRRVGRRRLRE